MSKLQKKPKQCRFCKFSLPEISQGVTLQCYHPVLTSKDPYVLAHSGRTHVKGASCLEERSKRWFASCGIKGKLWEAKIDD